jgi:hypothetical protein
MVGLRLSDRVYRSVSYAYDRISHLTKDAFSTLRVARMTELCTGVQGYVKFNHES